MKEERYFYVPEATERNTLPDDEAVHALRVLRLKPDDEMVLIDGQGTFFRAVVAAESTAHACRYHIIEAMPQQRPWATNIHLAIAPTKMMERMEWLTEKATEVGIDQLSLLHCRFSERTVVKTQRLEKIAVAAMKQSKKAWKPEITDMLTLDEFLCRHTTGGRFIAHCYDEIPRQHLFQELARLKEQPPQECVVMVGPEGDFSIDEVRRCLDAGFVSVTLGQSRLRTETAGLAAVMMMQLSFA